MQLDTSKVARMERGGIRDERGHEIPPTALLQAGDPPTQDSVAARPRHAGGVDEPKSSSWA